MGTRETCDKMCRTSAIECMCAYLIVWEFVDLFFTEYKWHWYQ